MRKEYLTKNIRSDNDKTLKYLKSSIDVIKKNQDKFKNNKSANSMLAILIKTRDN